MIRPVRADGSIETGGVFVPITRRRVIDRIASAALQRVVLIVAPAGYGKSVALRQYLDSTDAPHVRFDVLPDHAGLLGFLRGLSDAVSEIAPDARVTLPGAYEKNAASQSAGSDLALWMYSHLKSYRGIIAIDDLHIAQEDREVTRFLASLIDRSKGRIQWILASRSTLGLPIGTWLAYGDSDLAIDEHDLKFSAEEAREAARAFRLAVRDDELYELLNLTDGWATAMSFALRSSTRSVDLRNVSSMTREMIYRYLAEQVYETLNDEEQRFIETAALLPRVDLDVLLRAGFDRANALLETLRQRVAFIYEAEPGHYRLHDLFREFLRKQLELRGETAARNFIGAVGGALLALERKPEALRFFVDAHDREAIAQLLTSSGMTMINAGFADDVASALTLLTEFQGFDSSLRRALLGVIATSRGQYAEGEAQLYRAIETIDRTELQADLILRLALLRLNRGEDVRSLLELVLSNSELDSDYHIESMALLAANCASRGDIDAALAAIAAVEADLPKTDNVRSRARVMQRLGFAFLRLGRAQEATRYLKESVDVACGQAMWSVAARAYGLLANLAIMNDNSPSLSIWNAQQAAQAASRAGDYYDLQSSLLTLLSLETRRGNAERAQQIERQLAELSSTDASRTHYLASSQAHRHAWSARFSDAARLFGSVLDRQTYFADRVTVYALYALTLAFEGQNKASTAAIEKTWQLLESAAEGELYGSWLIDAGRLFLIVAELINGRLTVASRQLKKIAASDHEVTRLMRVLVEELLRLAKTPSYMVEDFEGSIDQIREFGWGGYAKYFAIARERLELRHDESVDTDVSLTPSELRVLRALAAGMAPKDVAAEMGRSVYTVQTHIQNVIEKLGCHGRAEAIATARRRGLLTSSNRPT